VSGRKLAGCALDRFGLAGGSSVLHGALLAAGGGDVL